LAGVPAPCGDKCKHRRPSGTRGSPTQNATLFKDHQIRLLGHDVHVIHETSERKEHIGLRKATPTSVNGLTAAKCMHSSDDSEAFLLTRPILPPVVRVNALHAAAAEAND